MANLLETGDVALVCQNGIWGQRFADMVERNGKEQSIRRRLSKTGMGLCVDMSKGYAGKC